MSPPVELSVQTFARLQAHAVPLVDNVETVINRMVDFYESKEGSPGAPSTAGDDAKVRLFNAAAPPDLRHTKVLSIEFCGRKIDHSRTNWNALLDSAIREAKACTKSSKELKSLVPVPFTEGQKTDLGYRYLSDIGISVQGRDANGAWRAIFQIAQQLGQPLLATFVWREKEGAAFPGMTGRFSMPARRSGAP